MYPTSTITRDEFAAAIEAGIDRNPSLTPEAINTLRLVASTVKRSLAGAFDAGEGYVCPLTAAGLRRTPGWHKFVSRFDSVVFYFVDYSPRRLDVKD
jgi:hypothetical protein